MELITLCLIIVFCRVETEIQTHGHLKLEFSVQASWYGPGFEGKTMANGEKFRQKKLTLAHRLLPLNTVVELSDETGKKVKARVTDRGPVPKDRDLDVSREIADFFEFREEGLKELTLRVVKLGKS